MFHIFENLHQVRKKIDKVAASSHRNGTDIHLVAVSKKQPRERIIDALDAGQRLFGENRVQDASAAWTDLKKQYPDIRLHLIGPLQSNKVKDAVALFDVIETIDRPKIAEELSREMNRQGRPLPCFIQVNTGEEEQKAGVIPAQLTALVSLCNDLNLNVRGLMCIPPEDESPALHFAFLKKLAARYAFQDLSMGMSADYELAIPLGATYVRVGTGIFGSRDV